MLNENEISRIVVGLCFKIHQRYGPGLYENVYEEIFCYEFGKSGIPFTRHKPSRWYRKGFGWISGSGQTL
jgi:GxxExxY protein